MKTYTWLKGTRYTVDANVVGHALEDIEETMGKVTPQALVKKAEAKTSPLHPLFEWDDTKAAARFRDHQARNVIRSVQVVVSEKPRKDQGVTVSIATRAFPYVPADEGYLAIDRVARDLTRFQSALYAVEAKVAGLNRLIADLEDAARQEAPDKAARIGALRQAFRRVDSALARIN
jgi:hypothetical protein